MKNFILIAIILIISLAQVSCGQATKHGNRTNPQKSHNKVRKNQSSPLVVSSQKLQTTFGWKIPKNQSPAQQIPLQAGAITLGQTVTLSGKDLPWTAFTLVLYINKNKAVKVLTQKRAQKQSHPLTIETAGGHLTANQTWSQGALDELMQEAGIQGVKASDLILLSAPKNPKLSKSNNLIWNMNFLLVFEGNRPPTVDTNSEIDASYGHQWINLNDLYLKMKAEDTQKGPKNDGIYYSNFRSHLINFYERVYPKMQGSISFSSIPNNTTLWNPNTYYVWGANANNYNLAHGTNLNGGGMAGPTGPTQGKAHTQYIGVITTTHGGSITAKKAININRKEVFPKLEDWLRTAAHTIVLPVDNTGKIALGTGLALQQNTPQQWNQIQKSLFLNIKKLLDLGATIDISSQPSFWPDLSGNQHPINPASTAQDIQNIINIIP